MSHVKHSVVKSAIGSLPAGKDIWQNSKYEVLKRTDSSRKGRIFKSIVRSQLLSQGFEVGPGGKGYSLLVDGIPVEVKGSTLWENGEFRFQQLRQFDAFKRAVLVAVSPNKIHMWYVTREDLARRLFHGTRHGQHGGQSNRTGTFWLRMRSGVVPSWFRDMDTF